MQLSLKWVVGLVAAAGIASASESNSFVVELTPRSNGLSGQQKFQRRPTIVTALNNKYSRALASFQRNTGRSHPLETNSSKKRRAQGNVDLVDIQQESEWGGHVSYGSPLQPIYVDFDTGSADTLVNPGAYNPSSSSTSKRTSDTFSAAYGDGTQASGSIYTDNAKLGASQGTNIAIGLSKTQFMSNSEAPNNGISGLALPPVQAFPSQYSPIFTALKNQGKLDQGVFQFTLKPGSGSLYVGGTDPSQYQGAVTYVSYDPSLGFYVAPATINGQKITTIVDSGTTLIIGPTLEVLSLFRKLPGVTTTTQQGMLTGLYDCANPPAITIAYGGTGFKLGKQQTSWGTQNGKCVLSIVGQNGLPLNAWIVGDVFFQMTSVIFDQDNNRLGFAAQPGTVVSGAAAASSLSSSKNTTAVPVMSSTSSAKNTTIAPAPIASSTSKSSSSSSKTSAAAGSASSSSKPSSVSSTKYVSMTSSVSPSKATVTSVSGTVTKTSVVPVMSATISGSTVAVTASQSVNGHHCGKADFFDWLICFTGEIVDEILSLL